MGMNEAIDKIRSEVRKIQGYPAEIRNILANLGEIEGVAVVLGNLSVTPSVAPKMDVPGLTRPVRRSRRQYPKHFTIQTNPHNNCLQEAFPPTEADPDEQPSLFCSEDLYEDIVAGIENMARENKPFDRFDIQEATAEVVMDKMRASGIENPEKPNISIPALLACLHLWLSIPEPLFTKSATVKDKFEVVGNVDDFEDATDEAWDLVCQDGGMFLAKPRYLMGKEKTAS